MNLYRVSRSTGIDFEECQSMIVQAPDEESAKKIHPRNIRGVYWDLVKKEWMIKTSSGVDEYIDNEWTSALDSLTVELIGIANPELTEVVIHLSFTGG